ncbi:MAG TPA: WXG100 family type VII secretion target [Candidatus Scybalocola faecigallinarum]|uniref:ESAT-6-like protein n=1 Tax=Candidatus Scybalocola faecigallinarum TaxID=2840941 RepID=A0A9D1JR58_9FIRM|nr:WXG100 family type VII secretion target [Candidatus Scybalocola faecigallinarum]
MATGRTGMTPEEVRQIAKRFDDEGENVSGIIDKMVSMCDELASVWEGDSVEAYQEKFEELKPGFQATAELIHQIASALKDTANAYEDTDKSQASKFRS